MASNRKMIYEIPQVIIVYDDETVERIAMSPYAPPSLEDPITRISSKDIVISRDVSARLYLPKLSPTNFRKLPIVVYYRGGGFIMGSAFGGVGTQVFKHSGVVYQRTSVEYRLAPERVIPAAYEDSWTALQWVASHSTIISRGENRERCLVEFGDFDRVYIGWDSAGANIGHHLTLKSGNEKLNNDLKIVDGFFGCPYFWVSKSTLDDDSLAYKCLMLANPHAQGGMDSPLINPFVGGRFEAKFVRIEVCISLNLIPEISF